MRITVNPEKRARTLSERGLDFARAGEFFAGRNFTAADLRGHEESPYCTRSCGWSRLICGRAVLGPRRRPASGR